LFCSIRSVNVRIICCMAGIKFLFSGSLLFEYELVIGISIVVDSF